MNLSKRQIKCLAAMKATGAELAQPDNSASWGVRSGNQWVRLKLGGGDVWQLVKAGLIVKHPTERRFNLFRAKNIIPVKFGQPATAEYSMCAA